MARHAAECRAWSWARHGMAWRWHGESMAWHGMAMAWHGASCIPLERQQLPAHAPAPTATSRSPASCISCCAICASWRVRAAMSPYSCSHGKQNALMWEAVASWQAKQRRHQAETIPSLPLICNGCPQLAPGGSEMSRCQRPPAESWGAAPGSWAAAPPPIAAHEWQADMKRAELAKKNLERTASRMLV